MAVVTTKLLTDNTEALLKITPDMDMDSKEHNKHYFKAYFSMAKESKVS